MSLFTKPVLYIDTREQMPLDFSIYKERFQHIVRATLEAGDYSIYGEEKNFVFERKSLEDLVSTVIHNKDRFVRELERMKDYTYAAILIEASYKTVASPYKKSRANPASVLGLLQSFQVRYDVDVIFAGSRANASRIIVEKVERHFYAQS